MIVLTLPVTYYCDDSCEEAAIVDTLPAYCRGDDADVRDEVNCGKCVSPS